MGIINSMRTNANVDWEFISFSFDGKNIYDFGVVAAASGDRYQRVIGGNYSHSYETVPGRVGDTYWGTSFGPSSVSFNLATDGMTSSQYKAFKQHFTGGKLGKLIYAEAPYSYCYARVETAPTFSFLPFPSTEVINGIEVMSYEYKGDMTLTFHLSDPRYYSDYATYSKWMQDSWFNGTHVTANGVTLVNMLANSNFPSTTSWYAQDTTATANNNSCRIVANATNAQHFFQQSFASTSVVIAGHQYYSAVNFSNVIGKVVLQVINKKADANYESSLAWYSNSRVSTILTATSVNASPSLIVRFTQANTAGATTFLGAGEEITASNCVLIDLTAAFGAGKEPTVSQMDTIMANASLNRQYWCLDSGLLINKACETGTLYCDSNKIAAITASALTYTDNTGLTYTANTILPFYNAGDFKADTKTSFAINLGTISGKITFFDTVGTNFYFSVGAKSDLSDGIKVVVRAPLVIRDFNKALDLLDEYSTTTITDDVKAEIRGIMYSNLEHDRVIAKMVSSISGNSTYAAIRTAFLGFFKNSTITITLDGISKEGKVSYTYNDGSGSGLLIEETSSDIMASCYIQVVGTSGLNSNGKIGPSCYISCSRALTGLKIEYAYTYI